MLTMIPPVYLWAENRHFVPVKGSEYLFFLPPPNLLVVSLATKHNRQRQTRTTPHKKEVKSLDLLRKKAYPWFPCSFVCQTAKHWWPSMILPSTTGTLVLYFTAMAIGNWCLAGPSKAHTNCPSISTHPLWFYPSLWRLTFPLPICLDRIHNGKLGSRGYLLRIHQQSASFPNLHLFSGTLFMRGGFCKR